jgi:hypothetical protein
MFYALFGRQLYLRYEDTNSLVAFETFGDAFMSVFQVITLDNWFDIITDNFNNSAFHTIVRPLYVLVLIFLGNMIFFNIFVTILLNGFQEAYNSTIEDEEADEKLFANDPDGIFLGDLDKTRKAIRDNIGRELKKAKKLVGKTVDLRNHENSFDDLEKLLDSKKYLKKIQELYDQVESQKSLYFFKKSHNIRKISFKIVNNSVYKKLLIILLITHMFLLIGLTFDNLEQLGYFLIPINIMFVAEASLNVISVGFIIERGSYMRNFFNAINILGILGFLISLIDSIYFQGVSFS